jgi:DNA repair exonuclease SbcCD ATPase subunit
MIIRQVTIRNWRGTSSFETELSPGLNILRGPNEAGKSSVVEAISWALHRDLVGGARVKDEIAPIIPASDPLARPWVELLLEFPDCRAVIRKTLAEDSAQRECRLTVQRVGVADQNFDQSTAQDELRRLMAVDGASASASTPSVDVALLVSAQGQSTRFVGQELSAAARAGVAVGENGAIAPTSRLEKVRVALEKKRGKELFEKLKANAVDAAKKQTDAARLRDELVALRGKHAQYSGIEAQIAALRAQIKTLQEEHARVAPRAEAAQAELEELRARRSAQLVVSGEVAEKRRARDEAQTQRDDLQKRIAEIATLRGEIARAEAGWRQLQPQLESERATEAAWREKAGAAWHAHENAEAEWRAARERLQAWDRFVEVCAANAERRRLRELCDQMEAVAHEAETRKAALEKLGRVPSRPQISRWREQYYAMENARQLAAQTLKIALQPEAGAELCVRADGGEATNVTARAGEEVLLTGQTSLTVQVAGWGTISASTVGREAQKQNAELAAKTRAMEKDLAVFGVTLADFPGALENLERRCADFESASQQLQFSEQQYQNALAGGPSLESLREQLAAAEAEYARARVACEPLRAAIPEGVKASQASIERERARERESEKQSAAEAARRAWQGALAAQNEAAKKLAALEARAAALEATRVQSAARLIELERDGADDAARQTQLDERNRVLWRAQEECAGTIQHLESLGSAVSEDVLASVAQEADELREAQHRLEKAVAEKRAELRGYCEQDPQTELDRLGFEIAACEEELARYEMRLRGLAILEAALEAERHRLGRAIAAPLNEHLSPWLSDLRGKHTRVEFDEDTGRLTGVLTEENGSTQVLPFSAHSGGMQEQTALALRLILAQAAAKKLPSAKLPLVLDDPLTQTDAARREGLWRVLQQAAQHLQILFVTCHETRLPHPSDVRWIALGEWSAEPLHPIVNEGKSKRANEIARSEKNGHQEPEAVITQTLSLW